MDFENLFWIAIVLFYFIFQLRGRKRAPEGAPPQPQRRAEPQNEELDEALQEIRRALGWDDEEEKPRPPVPVRTVPVPGLPSPEPQPSIRSVGDSPFSRETAFARQGDAVAAPRIKKLATVAKPNQARQSSAIVARLRDPENLRQEFLIREILGPPVALRRR